VMLGKRGNQEHVCRLKVERPMHDTISGTQQHADDELVVGRDALHAKTDIESTDAEREIGAADMRESSAQLAAAELDNVDMCAADGIMHAFEAIKLATCDREMLTHRHLHKPALQL
jgi:hypothetical protein